MPNYIVTLKSVTDISLEAESAEEAERLAREYLNEDDDVQKTFLDGAYLDDIEVVDHEMPWSGSIEHKE